MDNTIDDMTKKIKQLEEEKEYYREIANAYGGLVLELRFQIKQLNKHVIKKIEFGLERDNV
jgi:hypothetical protein